MDSSYTKNQDVSDLLAKDLVKRLIEKDNNEDTDRKMKKLKNLENKEMTKVRDYDLINIKCINKTSDEIENTLKELSSLNDLLNHALDKTLGLNEMPNTSINNIMTKNMSSSSINQEIDNFKLPNLPSSKDKSPLKSFEYKTTSRSKNEKLECEELSRKKLIENELFQSIVKEVISQNNDATLSQNDDESKHKKKKKNKHTHYCRKRKKRISEDEKQQNYDNQNENNKYCSSKIISSKKFYDSLSIGNKIYSENEYYEKPRNYDFLNKYELKHKYCDSNFKSNNEKHYKYGKVRKFEKYGKSYNQSYDKYYNNRNDLKDIFYLKKVGTENTLSSCTKLCRKISRKQDDDNSSIESTDFYSDNDIDSKSMVSERILNRDFFKTKEIKFDVRDFKTRQARTANEIKYELLDLFPVSSGTSHQWKEVDKISERKISEKCKKSSKSSVNLKISRLDEKVNDFLSKHVPEGNKSDFDIGLVMSQRLSALKILANDVNNITALNQLKKSNELINKWSLAKSRNEEESKKDLSVNAMVIDSQIYDSNSKFTKSVKSKDGIGIALLCKMGWQPGQGLGKNNEGSIEPLIPELKLDTKGLTTEEEKACNKQNNILNMYKIPLPASKISDPNKDSKLISDLNKKKNVSNNDKANCEQLAAIANHSIINGKHPVNVLQEVCSKRKWKAPIYTIVSEDGPAHKKNFLIKCTLNQVDYLPSFSSPNKKLAKAIAAIVCLQAFGLVSYEM